jgi:hypothetical protein
VIAKILQMIVLIGIAAPARGPSIPQPRTYETSAFGKYLPTLVSNATRTLSEFAIANELWPILSEEPEGKHRVVRVLIQTRKMVEHDGNPSRHNVLKFFCDWVNHPRLAGSAADLLASMRAKFNAAPIQKLADNVAMFSGPGGSVVVLNGPDGKFVVDTFVAPAWPKLKATLDGLGNAPVKYVIDTHWHFDHTDNNAPLRAAGATVLADENTKKRMSEPHDLAILYRGADAALADLHFDPSPGSVRHETGHRRMAVFQRLPE